MFLRTTNWHTHYAELEERDSICFVSGDAYMRTTFLKALLQANCPSYKIYVLCLGPAAQQRTDLYHSMGPDGFNLSIFNPHRCRNTQASFVDQYCRAAYMADPHRRFLVLDLEGRLDPRDQHLKRQIYEWEPSHWLGRPPMLILTDTMPTDFDPNYKLLYSRGVLRTIEPWGEEVRPHDFSRDLFTEYSRPARPSLEEEFFRRENGSSSLQQTPQI